MIGGTVGAVLGVWATFSSVAAAVAVVAAGHSHLRQHRYDDKRPLLETQDDRERFFEAWGNACGSAGRRMTRARRCR